MGDITFHLKPWTPRVRKTAEMLIYRVHAVAPELEVLFMGAAALGLPGKNDIDLDILCEASKAGEYTKKLLPTLGEPREVNNNVAAWTFELNGFEVDCMLSDPKTSHVPLQRIRFEILKSNPKLLEEYRKLKEACEGLPLTEYEQRKASFLEKRVCASSNQPS